MTDGLGFADIKAELLRRLASLLPELAPGGRMANGYYMARNPTRDDRRPGSFWVRTAGAAIGAWRDEATGDRGDIIGLVAYCKGLADHRATRDWCLDWLGWRNGIDRRQLETRRAAARRDREDDERRGADELADKRRRAKGWWLHAVPMIEGTPAAAYLASRGIDIARLAQPPRALRFLPAAEHRDADGAITVWPAMLAAMCGPGGQIVAVHRTFLAPDGSAKAPVLPAKKIWPHGWHGAAIRLSKGASGLRPEEAVKRMIAGPLVLTEGIEDGLSVALACPELRVWAAGTLGNFAHVPVDHACVSRVILFADNDAGPQARAQLDKAVAALRIKRPVAVARAFAGKDANDLLRGLSHE